MIKVDIEKHEVRVKGKEVELMPKEFQLLVALINSGGKCMTRPVLMKQVWGVDAQLETRTIDQHVARLRKKIGPNSIETVSGYGYKYRG